MSNNNTIHSVQIRTDNYDIKNNPKVKDTYPALYKEVLQHDKISTSSWYDLSDKAYLEYVDYLEDDDIGYLV